MCGSFLLKKIKIVNLLHAICARRRFHEVVSPTLPLTSKAQRHIIQGNLCNVKKAGSGPSNSKVGPNLSEPLQINIPSPNLDSSSGNSPSYHVHLVNLHRHSKGDTQRVGKVLPYKQNPTNFKWDHE